MHKGKLVTLAEEKYAQHPNDSGKCIMYCRQPTEVFEDYSWIGLSLKEYQELGCPKEISLVETIRKSCQEYKIFKAYF